MDRDATHLFRTAGALFPPASDRVEDLHEAANRFGFDYRETEIKPELGEAIVFLPSLTLHRAKLPEKGERITMTLLCLPSATSWGERIRGEYLGALQNHACGFPPLEDRVTFNS